MSKYTTEVRYICETNAGLTESTDNKDVDRVLEKCVSNIFDFDFPIFDEYYRKVLEKKILKHYYTREIGFETVGLWKLKLNTKLNEIMPYYNQLYRSELLEFNPFYDVDLTTDHNTQGGVSSNASGSGINRNLYSDTPQGGLAGLDNETYLTSYTKDINNSNSNSNINSTEDYLEHVKGKRGNATYSDLLLKYRETFLNIDVQIIDELSDLFFGLW